MQKVPDYIFGYTMFGDNSTLTFLRRAFTLYGIHQETGVEPGVI